MVSIGGNSLYRHFWRSPEIKFTPVQWPANRTQLLMKTKTIALSALLTCGVISLQAAPVPTKSAANLSGQINATRLGQIADATWFPLDASSPKTGSVMGMENWLDAPAGKHGGVRMVDDQFQFEDKTPVKFWGTNLAYAACAPDTHSKADGTAQAFAHFGVNGVRLHKFTGPMGWEGIGDPNDVTKFDNKGIDNLDYFTAALTKNGVYYGFSHTYNMGIREGNRDKILAYDEIKNNLKGRTSGLINVAPDLQDLVIQMVVNLLNHTNTYTGKKYAEDPALSYVEMQNEDDVFWWNAPANLKKCPTYLKAVQGRFSDWLQQKYSSQDGLVKAWGAELKDGETLDQKNVDVAWPADMTGAKQLSPRNIDTALFLFNEQNTYYAKFAKAIRDTGYQGPICGSPWQAAEMMPHFLNLKSDYLAGFIDRHNYYGYISTGLQQVADRPFGISEWITNAPMTYTADGPVLLAAYGFGLQGWDSSYEFQSDLIKSGVSPFDPKIGTGGNDSWHVNTPTQLGQFPALSRMIFRGDIKQGDIISTRVVSTDDLTNGKFNFAEKNEAKGDVKGFNGDCPQSALAAGRCVVQFTDKSAPSTMPDMTKYTKGTAITSTTGELVWDSANNGFITINTAGTKAVVGFAQGKAQALGNVSITSQTPYASIILTAMDKTETLDNAKSALLTLVARAANGSSGVVMEPVHADIAISGHNVSAVNVLDQNGVPTGQTVTVNNGSFHIDTGADKTFYYQVMF
jgi:hypothetical protein